MEKINKCNINLRIKIIPILINKTLFNLNSNKITLHNSKITIDRMNIMNNNNRVNKIKD